MKIHLFYKGEWTTLEGKNSSCRLQHIRKVAFKLAQTVLPDPERWTYFNPYVEQDFHVVHIDLQKYNEEDFEMGDSARIIIWREDLPEKLRS